MTAKNQLTLTARSTHDPVPDLTSLAVVHRAIRQDLAQLAALLTATSDRNLPSRQARALNRYVTGLLAAIRAHLDGEDRIVWPVIAATARQAVDLTPLADDHQAIRVAARRTGHALARFAAQPSSHGSDLRAAVRDLREQLDDHISDEEAQLFPAMRRYLPAGAYLWCQRRIQRDAAASDLRFSLPWLMRHARDDEVRQLLAASGWRARVLLAFSRLSHGRLIHRAFGTGRGPRNPDQ